MAKDYAKRTNRRQDWYSSKPKARSHSNVWVLLVGLVMGFMVAAFFYMLQQPNSMLHKASLAFLQKSAKSHDVEVKAAKPTVMAKTTKADAPHFDFYTILPKEQVPTTKEQDANQTVMAAIKKSTGKDEEAAKAPGIDAEEEIFANLTKEQTAKKIKTEEVATADDNNDDSKEKIAPKYILQIGKFSKYSDADELRAQLVMMGYETNIKTTHHDGESISRVWLGPFTSMASAQKIQQQLAENQIKSMVMRDS